MARIPSRTVEDAPDAARPLLEAILHTSPTGKTLNFQGQMAHSPVVLVSYVGMRRATDVHGTLEPRHRSAIMLTAAAAIQSEYTQAIMSILALRVGWTKAEVASLRSAGSSGDGRLDALLAVAGEAAADNGNVGDGTWRAALSKGWSDDQLTEVFAYVGLVAYTACFINYARTDLDVPALADA
jgi:hypothetical protein